MATTLWASKQQFSMDASILRELQRILDSLRTEEWKLYIPHMIPRDHHCVSIGDASLLGGGAFSRDLQYWFRIMWSKQIVAGTKRNPSDPGYIHINTLEFLVAFLQVVAFVVILESPDMPEHLRERFPQGFPCYPHLCNHIDNTATQSWTNGIRTTSPHAQALVSLYGQLMQRFHGQCNSVHLPGDENSIADFFSRPDSPSHERLLFQAFQNFPLAHLPAECRANFGLQLALSCDSK